ncbi:MAG: hypothetical protein ACR2GQ_06270 [Gemmatimonadota bacterium]
MTASSAQPVEALQAVSRLTLVIWPAESVRAALPAGATLGDLSDDELAELRAGARPLTVTERIIEADGAAWLVQQTGPAWAEEGGASDLCGLMFTRLDGSARRWALVGRAPGPIPGDEALVDLLEQARRGE